MYLEAALTSPDRLAVSAAGTLVVLLSILTAACAIAARIAARIATKDFHSIGIQLDCLKENEPGLCALAAHENKEALTLSAKASELHRYLQERTVPRTKLVSVRHWYWELFARLLSSLRSYAPADSPIPDLLDDYALLLQAVRGDTLPPPNSFDIAQLLDEALHDARRRESPQPFVHVGVSLQPRMQNLREGQPELVKVLLRHLLLIGIKRTQQGYVRLRVEEAPPPMEGLQFLMQDSGPFIQPWQLQQWLSATRDDSPAISTASDISWILAGSLIKRLGGDLSGTSTEDGSLILEGFLPMPPSFSHQMAGVPKARTAHGTPPLLLIVEERQEQRRHIEKIVREAACDPFVVSSHRQAVEWAPVLPFSAIVLNANSDGARRACMELRRLSEAGEMPDVPRWMMVTRLSFIEFDEWRQQGISELLMKPLQADIVKRLRCTLPARDEHFYLVGDTQLQEDMASLPLKLADIRRMLDSQLPFVLNAIRAQLTHQPLPASAQVAHGVRSAALASGYLRLARVMGEIEHQFNGSYLEDLNWRILLSILQSIRLKDAPAIRRLNPPIAI